MYLFNNNPISQWFKVKHCLAIFGIPLFGITLVGITLVLQNPVFGQEFSEGLEFNAPLNATELERSRPLGRPNRTIYSYQDRHHTRQETFRHVGIIYGVSWVAYPLTQPDTVRRRATWTRYRHNFGQLVFDQDEPFWNWFVHPLSGSQLYLYYRANGFSRSSALGLAFVSSTLFEFTIEVFTEPASFQDLYQTPILGSVLGLGIEKLSLVMLNTGNPVAVFFGHLINPCTLFPFFEGKALATPTVYRHQGHQAPGILFAGEF